MSQVEPRDPAKPVSYYREFIEQQEALIRNALEKDAPILFFNVSNYCFRIAVAAYSAGDPVPQCLHWFGETASFRVRAIAEGRGYKFVGYGTIEDYLELYAGAFLAAKARELIRAFRRSAFERPPAAAQTSLMNQFCAVLEGELAVECPIEEEGLKQHNPQWALLPPLFRSAAGRDLRSFGPALEQYLAKSWAPSVERWAKSALKSKTSEYCGKWCLLSAALCKIAGDVPAISQKTRKYIPDELVKA
jgi:hypothetical protein